MMDRTGERKPLLENRQSDWQHHVLASHAAAKKKDSADTRCGSIITVGGAILTPAAIGGAYLVHHFVQDWKVGLPLLVGTVLVAVVGGGMVFMGGCSLAEPKRADRKIFKIALDTNQAAELSRDLCSQDFGQLHSLLNGKYSGVQYHELVDLDFIKQGSKVNMKSLSELFSTATTKVFGTLRNETVSFINTKWQALRNKILQEVPFPAAPEV